uniref:Uncharacterized protein n=1 Tax=Arundo donax TaxID=35708 RepID=A0A0A9GNN1_ARUDO
MVLSSMNLVIFFAMSRSFTNAHPILVPACPVLFDTVKSIMSWSARLVIGVY